MASTNGASSPKFKLVKATELRLLPPVRLLGNTHIVAEGFNVIFGPSGSYKSFYALNLALDIAQSDAVVYVAAEGASGLQIRVEAWCEHFKLSEGNLEFITEEVNLLDTATITRFVNTLKTIKRPVRLVIFDTYARCMPGGDENSAKDAGLAIRHCATIQRAFNTAITVVHHANRAETGERGSGALRGAADAMIEIIASDNEVRVECSKMKDWEAWSSESYRFQPVGKSGLLLPADDVHLPERLNERDIKVLDALNMNLFEDCGASVRSLMAVTNLPQIIIYRVLSKLKDGGLARQDKKGDPFHLTLRGEKALLTVKPSAKISSFNPVVDY